MIMRTAKGIRTALLLCAATAMMGACATEQSGYQSKVDSVMARTGGDPSVPAEPSLSVLEKVYKNNSGDPEAAWKYAHGLRKAGYHSRAAMVLRPFATSTSKAPGSPVLTEYAAIQAALGDYKAAEDYSRKAVLADTGSGQAYHVLGIALDAQGHHKEAQVAFEKGLDNWEGNPSPILNNIGLNLAAQGFLDEAIETLRKALDTAPDRAEIERNLRIVAALQYQPPVEGMRHVPRPPRKPDPAQEEINMPGPDAVPLEEVEMEAVD